MTQLTATKAPVIRIGGTAADVTPGRAVLRQRCPNGGVWLLLHSRDDGPLITPEFDDEAFICVVVADHTATAQEARKAARAHLTATHYDGDPTRAHKVAAAIQRYLRQIQRPVTSEELFFALTDAFTAVELSGAFLEFGGHVADGSLDGDRVTVADVTRAMLALCVNTGKWGTYTRDVNLGVASPPYIDQDGNARYAPIFSYLECESRDGAHRFHPEYCA